MSVGTYDTQLFILLAKEQGLQCASTARLGRAGSSKAGRRLT